MGVEHRDPVTEQQWRSRQRFGQTIRKGQVQCYFCDEVNSKAQGNTTGFVLADSIWYKLATKNTEEEGVEMAQWVKVIDDLSLIPETTQVEGEN